MYCTTCGAQLPHNSTVCTSCGAHITTKAPGETVGLLSMIFGLVSLVALATSGNLSLPAAIAAVVCGFISKSHAKQAGIINNFAQTGLICGFVAIGINVVYTILALCFVAVYMVFYVVVMMGILGMSMGAGMYM